MEFFPGCISPTFLPFLPTPTRFPPALPLTRRITHPDRLPANPYARGQICRPATYPPTDSTYLLADSLARTLALRHITRQPAYSSAYPHINQHSVWRVLAKIRRFCQGSFVSERGKDQEGMSAHACSLARPSVYPFNELTSYSSVRPSTKQLVHLFAC